MLFLFLFLAERHQRFNQSTPLFAALFEFLCLRDVQSDTVYSIDAH